MSAVVGFAGFLVCLVAAAIKTLYEGWKNKDEVQ
jgi:hypothetical protein